MRGSAVSTVAPEVSPSIQRFLGWLMRIWVPTELNVLADCTTTVSRARSAGSFGCAMLMQTWRSAAVAAGQKVWTAPENCAIMAIATAAIRAMLPVFWDLPSLILIPDSCTREFPISPNLSVVRWIRRAIRVLTKSSMLSQFFRTFRCSSYRRHDRTREPVVLQGPESIDGGSTRRGHLTSQNIEIQTRFLRQFDGSCHRGHGQPVRNRPGEAREDSPIFQGHQEFQDIGRSASR